MPYSDPTANFPQQALALLQVLSQLKTAQTQRLTAQADASIGRLLPGATVQQSGLTPKQQKAKFGRELLPGDVLVPETPESKASKILSDRIANFTPDEVDLFASSLQNKLQGTPGVATRASLASAGRTATTTAATGEKAAKTQGAVTSSVQDMVLAGLDELSKAKPEVKARVGLQAAGLPTVEAAQASTAQDKINLEAKRMALQALSDPKHPLNEVMQKQLGFNAITAAAGVGMGMSDLLGETARIALQRLAGSNATNLAILQAQLDQDKQLNDAEASWAKDTATRMGDTYTPRSILNWKRWKEAGGDPATMPRGVTTVMDAQLSAATAIQQRALVTEAAQKGDPYANTLMSLIQMGAKVSDKNTLESISKLITDYFGKVQNATINGPRPTDDAQAAARWDAAAAAISAKMPRFEAKFWGGVGLQPGEKPAAPNPMGAGIGAPPGGQTTPQLPGVPPNALNLQPGSNALGPQPGLSQTDLQAIQEIVKAIQAAGATPALPGTKPPGTP